MMCFIGSGNSSLPWAMAHVFPFHGSHTWSCLFYRLKVQVNQLVGSAPYFIIFTNDKFSED